MIVSRESHIILEGKKWGLRQQGKSRAYRNGASSRHCHVGDEELRKMRTLLFAVAVTGVANEFEHLLDLHQLAPLVAATGRCSLSMSPCGAIAGNVYHYRHIGSKGRTHTSLVD